MRLTYRTLAALHGNAPCSGGWKPPDLAFNLQGRWNGSSARYRAVFSSLRGRRSASNLQSHKWRRTYGLLPLNIICRDVAQNLYPSLMVTRSSCVKWVFFVAQIEKLGNIQLMFRGGIEPFLPIVLLLTRVRTLVMELPEPSCKLDKWTSHLESEVGIEPTLSRFCRPRPVPISRTRPLKVQAKVDSDHHIRFWRPSCYHWHHSPIEMVACIHASGIGKSTAKFPSPKNIFTQCKAWNGRTGETRTRNSLRS